MPRIPESQVGNVAARGFVPRAVDTSGLMRGIAQFKANLDEKEKNDGRIIAAEKMASMSKRINEEYVFARDNSVVTQDENGNYRSQFNGEALNTWMERRIDQIKSEELDGVTNQYALDSLAVTTPNFTPQYSSKVLAYESKAVLKERINVFNNAMNDLGRLAVDSGGDDFDMYVEMVDGMGLDHQARLNAKGSLAWITGLGLLNENPAALLRHLDGETGTTMRDYLEGDQIAQLRARATAKLKSASASTSRQAKSDLPDLLATIKNTGNPHTAERARLVGMLDNDIDKREWNEKLNAAQLFGQAKNRLEYATKEDADKILAAMRPTDPLSGQDDWAVYNEFKKVYHAWWKEVTSDPVAYAEKRLAFRKDEFKTEDAWIDGLINEQLVLGVEPHQVRYLSNTQLDKFAHSFINAQENPQQFLFATERFNEVFGKNERAAGYALAEIADYDGVQFKEGYRTVIRSMANKLAQSQDLATSIANFHTNKKNIPSEVYKGITTTIFQKFQPYRERLMKGSNGTASVLLDDQAVAIEALAAYYTASGQDATTPRDTGAKAADRAWKELIGNQLHDIDSGTFILPKVIKSPDGKSVVATDYSKFKKILEIKRREIVEGNSDLDMNFTFGPNKEFMQHTLRTRFKHAEWVTNNGGVELIIQPYGVKALNSQGVPIRYDFFEIYSLGETDLLEKESMKSAKDLFDRMSPLWKYQGFGIFGE